MESYDENGNILSYLRHGNTAVGPLAMDSLTYHYNINTNQLAEVNDAGPATNYTVDIDNETSTHNYRYNAIGELASDSIAGIDSIYWTVYGKVEKIVKTNGDSIVFMYDPMGNRLENRLFPYSGTGDTTKYTRDASGNIMAIYDRKKDTVRLSEFDIYGNRRLGSLDTVLRMQKFITGHGTLDSLTISYLERQKQYELDNHLGNVMITVSDGKTPIDTDLSHGKDTAYYYTAIVVNAQDYYPFGMVEPGRSYTIGNDSSYRFGFNGKLHDDNIYGKNNSYDYGARFYDPRLGKWLSTDPLAKQYVSLSPYNYAGDNPLYNIDVEGKKIFICYEALKNDGTTIMIKVQYKNGGLYQNGKPYIPPKDVDPNAIHYINGVKHDLDQLKKGDAVISGRVQALEKDDQPTHIIHNYDSKHDHNQTEPAQVNPGQPGGYKDSHNGTQQGSTVYYDPDNKKGPVDNRAPVVGLAHELAGHSYDLNYGIVPTGSTNGVANEELRAIDAENRERAVLGEPSRTKVNVIINPKTNATEPRLIPSTYPGKNNAPAKTNNQ